jgi:hypothetical protein
MSEDPLALVTPPAASDADYDSIYATLAETSRGRWFLAEYARRSRPSDTESSLAAIARIEAALRIESAAQSVDRFRFDVLDMAQAIVRTKAEIAAIKPDPDGEGKVEDASGNIAAEAAQKAIALLNVLESRLHAVIEAWGEARPPAAEEQLAQTAGEPLVASFEEPAPGENAAKETTAAHAEERQDATLEDIGRFMMALDPLVAAGPQAEIALPRPPEEMDTAATDEGEPADFLLGPAPELPSSTPIPPAPALTATAAKNPFEAILADALDALIKRPQPAAHTAEPAPMSQKATIPVAASEPAATPVVIATPAGLPNDPLASLRALSDAEKIALFS